MFIIVLLKKNIFYYIEDVVKSRQDYGELVKKYYNVDSVTTKNDCKLLVEEISDLRGKEI